MLVVVAAVAVFVIRSRMRRAPAESPAQAEQAPAAVAPLGAAATPIALPPLDQTDSLVRDLVRQLTAHPSIAAWLATDGLLRNFTVVVSNVADGSTPARQLQAVRPKGSFLVVERGGQLFIDPNSYRRYDPMAAAAESVDPAAVATLYSTLKPRIEDAYAELGARTPFDRTLERALVSLLETPVVDGPVRVEPRGIGYRFDNPRLEGLSAAQKQLLRTGPENVRRIKAALRAIALALGIPAARLPPANR
jgi:hypothetical protein